MRLGRFRGACDLVVTPLSRQDSLVPGARHVLVLAVEGCQALDVIGPVEVFCFASSQVRGAYDVQVVGATDGDTIMMSNGLRLGVAPLPEPPERHDTLVVAGGAGARAAVDDAGVVDWVARAAGQARRTTSVCTGAYLLAAAGLLDGRRATTHWRFCEDLADSRPAVEVDSDPVFIRDGNVWTSAGITTGMDLALALVEEDLGPEVALCRSTAGRLPQAPGWPVAVQWRAGGPASCRPGAA